MSWTVFDHTKSPCRPGPRAAWWSQPRLPRRTDGYLKSGSIMSISLLNVPAGAPVTVVGWLSGSATNGMLVGGVARRADAGEVDSGVAELIRDPHVRRPAREQPDAATDLLRAPAIQVVVERRRAETTRRGSGPRRWRSRSWRPPPGWRSACRERRRVDADAVGQRHVRPRAPLSRPRRSPTGAP